MTSTAKQALNFKIRIFRKIHMRNEKSFTSFRETGKTDGAHLTVQSLVP
jgi:hypothetical protein